MDQIDELLNKQNYWEVFEPSETDIRDRYIELAKRYHPDSFTDSRGQEVFEHIAELKKKAMEALKKGEWQKPGCVCLAMRRGGWLSFQYEAVKDFELGKTYIGCDKIMYRIDESQIKYYENALERIKNFSFADSGMMGEFIPILPRLIREGITIAGDGVLIIEKHPNEYPLTEIYEKTRPALEARHIAWIISRLSNICCYLQYSGLAHNGLTIENLFINPIDHNISLYGGWWYAVKEDAPLIGTTTDVYDIMSDYCKNEKRAECITDQEMVREIAKLLAGNNSMVFKRGEKTDIPEAMAAFIRSGSCGDAFEEFRIWNNTLDLSWGKRKFVQMHIPGIC